MSGQALLDQDKARTLVNLLRASDDERKYIHQLIDELEECQAELGQKKRVSAESSPTARQARPSSMVFLCHSAGDKERVRELYRSLTADDIKCWFDEEDLLPGQDWDYQIRKAMRASRHVVVCLSKSSVTKTGYVQKELRRALDLADEQPEGSTFVIPVRLEECEVPDRLRRWQWVDLFDKSRGYERLRVALTSHCELDTLPGADSSQRNQRSVLVLACGATRSLLDAFISGLKKSLAHEHYNVDSFPLGYPSPPGLLDSLIAKVEYVILVLEPDPRPCMSDTGDKIVASTVRKVVETRTRMYVLDPSGSAEYRLPDPFANAVFHSAPSVRTRANPDESDMRNAAFAIGSLIRD
jgi:hypothetical protein